MKLTNSNDIPYLKIASKLDLKPNDTLLISSDISKLIYNTAKNKEVFNPKDFIKSFETELLEGNLLFPAFINNFNSGDYFNIKDKKTDSGILSKTSLELQNFYRNFDPLHSFSLTGKDYKYFLNSDIDSTFGVNSIFSKLVEKNAKMLIIDLDLNHSFTFAHFVEESVKVSYRKYKMINYFLVNEDKTEKKSIKFYRKKIGFENALNELYVILRNNNALSEKIINNVNFTIIELKKAHEIIKFELSKNKRKLVKFNFVLFLKEFFKSIYNA